jgi:hypothetical protein
MAGPHTAAPFLPRALAQGADSQVTRRTASQVTAMVTNAAIFI